MLTLLSTLATSGILGGLTGLLGTIWSSYNKRKLAQLEIESKKADRAHELAMVKAETDAMIAKTNANIKVVETETAGAIELAETKAFSDTIEASSDATFEPTYMDKLFDTEGWLRYITIPAAVMLAMAFGFLDFIKGSLRPGITVFMLGVSTWVNIKAWDLMNRIGYEKMTAKLASGIMTDSINVISYLTVTSVTWWFGDRMATKGMAKSMFFKKDNEQSPITPMKKAA